MRSDLPVQHWQDLANDKNYPVVVCYFTPGFYMREAFELMRSCQEHGLDFSIDQVDSSGSWLANSRIKPSFLLQKSLALPDRDLLWLDADARVRGDIPQLWQCKSDVAAHTFRNTLCASTIFLRRGWQRNTILRKWIHELELDPEGLGPETTPEEAAVGAPDQVALARALRKLGVEHEELPAEYCWFYDLALDKQGTPANVKWVPVIEHTQANRWAKRMESNNVLPG